MRRLLLSDIHSNLEALTACLTRAGEAGYDGVLCCGDIVGYGPDPNATVEAVRRLEAVTIRGNHDRVSCGLDEPVDFNPHAKAAAYWTRDALSPENRAFLRSLPAGPLPLEPGAQLVHGAVTHEDDYILCEAHAVDSFALTTAPLTFFGHSHFPCVFSCDRARRVTLEPVRCGDDGLYIVDLDPAGSYLVNPGSAGQPRDGDARGSFAIWDVDTSRLEFHRAPYPFEITQRKMRAAGLPPYLIERLARGR